MICKKCGSVQPDSANFCNNCGAAMIKEQKPIEEKSHNENGKKALAALKKTAGSRLFSVYVFLSSAFFVLTAASLIYSYFASCNGGLISMFFLDMRAVGADAKTISVLILIVLLPLSFTLLGKWLFYLSAKKEKLSTAGINICKGVCIVCAAFLSIALFGMFFVGLTEVIDVRDSGIYTQQYMTIKILVTSFSLLLLVFCVAYYSFLLRMLFGFSKTIREEQGTYVSMTYIVLNFLLAAACLVFCAYNFSTDYAYIDGAVNLFSTLPLLFSVPLRVIFPILLLKYKKASA